MQIPVHFVTDADTSNEYKMAPLDKGSGERVEDRADPVRYRRNSSKSFGSLKKPSMNSLTLPDDVIPLLLRCLTGTDLALPHSEGERVAELSRFWRRGERESKKDRE